MSEFGHAPTAGLLGVVLLSAMACTPVAETAVPWPRQGIAWTDGSMAHVWWEGDTADPIETHWIYGWVVHEPWLLYSTSEGFAVFDAERQETAAHYTCSCNVLVGTDPEFPIIVYEYDQDELIWLDSDLEPLATVAVADILPSPLSHDPGFYPGDVHGSTLYFGYAEYFNERVLADGIYGVNLEGEVTPVLPEAREYPPGRMDLYVSPSGDTIAYVQRQDRSTCERWAGITLLDATGAEEPQEIALPTQLRDRSTEIGHVYWEGEELLFSARESGFFGHLVMPCEGATDPLVLSAVYSAGTEASELSVEAVLMERPLRGGGSLRLTSPAPGDEGPLLQIRRDGEWSTIAERPGDVHIQPVSP